MRGIYKITNKINNKVYIGETLDIRRRWGEHKDNLKNNTHHSYKLQNDWNKYGEKNFEFEIISVLDETINGFVGQYVLILYEQEYILKYNSIDNGYNIEETLSEIKKGKKIITNIKKDNLLLYEYYNRIKNNIIINKGGLIYVNIFDMESICKIFKLDKEKIKGLLYNNNIIILNSTNKSYMLNESIFNKNDIISNNKFSNIKFNGIIYSKLIDEINKIYEKGKLDFEIIKYKEPIVNTKPEINKKSCK
jgi:group I intron endonuclease